MKVGFVYDEVFLQHETPRWHPECKERLISIVSTLKDSPLWNNLLHIKPRKASFADVEVVHQHRYVEKVRQFGEGYIDPDTYISGGSIDAALYAAGAVMEAAEQCRKGKVSRVFCAVRPPGHHAEADRAMGFCIFNNVAVGTRFAQKIGFEKVFIVDFDVHHGNGTQHIFEEDGSVYYFSTHQYPHYPGTGSDSEHGMGKGKGFTRNIPMPGGSGDKEFFSAYHDLLPRVVKEFDPALLLVSAGYDIHKDDPLASIRVSDEGIRDMVKSILSLRLPTVFSLEGGYNLKALGGSVLITIEEMMKD